MQTAKILLNFFFFFYRNLQLKRVEVGGTFSFLLSALLTQRHSFILSAAEAFSC